METTVKQFALPSPSVAAMKNSAPKSPSTLACKNLKETAQKIELEVAYMEEEIIRIKKLITINRQTLGQQKHLLHLTQIQGLQKNNLRLLSNAVTLIKKDLSILQMGKQVNRKGLENDAHKLNKLLQETIAAYRKILKNCLIDLTENYSVSFF